MFYPNDKRLTWPTRRSSSRWKTYRGPLASALAAGKLTAALARPAPLAAAPAAGKIAAAHSIQPQLAAGQLAADYFTTNELPNNINNISRTLQFV